LAGEGAAEGAVLGCTYDFDLIEAAALCHRDTLPTRHRGRKQKVGKILIERKESMTPSFRRDAVVFLCGIFALLLFGCGGNQTASGGKSPGLEEAVSTATDAYIYGYPLVTMDMTRKFITNYSTVQGNRGPMGKIIKYRTYPAVDDHAVTAPNADTLYTTAFIDVSKEPWVFSIPDMGDRYYLMPMLDGWTDVFQDPGKTHYGRQSAEVRHHRTGMVGQSASRSHRI
jgi:hypothetical protein